MLYTKYIIYKQNYFWTCVHIWIHIHNYMNAVLVKPVYDSMKLSPLLLDRRLVVPLVASLFDQYVRWIVPLVIYSFCLHCSLHHPLHTKSLLYNYINNYIDIFICITINYINTIICCFSAYDYVVEPKGKVLAKTDLQIALPDGCYGRIGAYVLQLIPLSLLVILNSQI